MTEVNVTKVSRVFNSFKMVDIAVDILSRMDAPTYDELFQAMDAGLIFTADQWEVMAYYCSIEEADWGVALEGFENDLMECLDAGAVELEEEDE